MLGERIVRIAVQVVLHQLHIDLAAEPDEALHRIDLFIRLRRLVLHAVVDVVDRCLGAPVVRHLRPAGERNVRPVVRVVRVHAAFVRAANGQADVAAVAAACHRHVGVDHETGLPEVAHVVRVRHPRPCAEELIARMGIVIHGRLANYRYRVGLHPHASGRPTVELGPPALVGEVVRPTAVTIHEVELPAEALAVLILIVGEPQRRLGGCAERGRHAEALLRCAAAALGRVHDRAIGGARAVQRRSVGALQDRHRRDVVGADVRSRVADVIPAQVARSRRSLRTVSRVPRRGVVDWDAVDDDQRLVLPENRACTADDDARRAERVRGVRHLHAGDFALQRRDHVVRAHVGQPVAAERLRGVREAALLTLDAERGHDFRLELDGAFFERDVLRDI